MKTKVRGVFLVAVILLTLSLKSQDNIDLYLETLKKHVEVVKGIAPERDTFYLLNAEHLGDYNLEVNGVSIKLIDEKWIYNNTKKKKVVNLTIIKPVKSDGNTISVTISEMTRSRKGKKYTALNHGNTKHSWNFNCETGKYESKAVDIPNNLYKAKGWY